MAALPDEAESPRAFFRLILLIWVTAAAFLSSAFTFAYLGHFQGPGDYFLIYQDLPVLALFVAIAASLFVVADRRPLTIRAPAPRAYPIGVALLAVSCLAVGLLAAPWVFEGYTLSADEFLANFDARIFASGRLFAPIDPAWRPFARAMQPHYLLPIPGDVAWASSYLPVNAALRAAGRLIHAENLVNPALSAFSVGATYAVGRRLWPDDRRTAAIAAMLLAVSPQLLVMSMTAYAMPAHLAFNLAWLWLFLRGGRIGHSGALVVGCFATGLHQVAFHPCFAAPFVLQLWLDRRLALASIYTLAYAAICGFWLEYWPIEMRLAGFPAHVAAGTGAGWFAERVQAVVAQVQFGNLGAMAEGLVRFATWQAPLTLPLVVLAIGPAIRVGGPLRALVIGLGLTLALALLAVPSQVHGWGYRYLHGLLGSACLLAAWSWTRLTRKFQPSADAVLVASCVLSLVVMTPVRAWQARQYNHPYAVASRLIAASRADVVLIAHDDNRFFDVGTLTRTGPFLDRSPKVMVLSEVTAPALLRLCRTQSVAVFDGSAAAGAGVDVMASAPSPEDQRRLRELASLGCRLTPLAAGSG